MPDGAADACLFGLNEADEKVAQCDAYLVDQADVDALSGVVEVSGDLHFLAARPIDDLTALASLRHIGGSLSVSGLRLSSPSPKVSSLAGLDALESVEGSLSLYKTRLVDVGPFPVLTHIGGSLRVKENAVLENLDGLGALESIGGDIELIENDALLSVSGLGGVTQIGGQGWTPCDGGTLGNVEAMRNPVLASLDGLSGVQVARAVLIAGEAIGSVDGLSGLTSAERLELNTPAVAAGELEQVRSHVALCDPSGADTDDATR